MGLRRTIVVHTRLAAHVVRVHAARGGESGVQILTMGQLAARFAGGLLRPIDPDDLKTAVRESLASVQLGELEPIKDLPGMLRAAAGTLDKVWSAGIDLSAGAQHLRAREHCGRRNSGGGCCRCGGARCARRHRDDCRLEERRRAESIDHRALLQANRRIPPALGCKARSARHDDGRQDHGSALAPITFA